MPIHDLTSDDIRRHLPTIGDLYQRAFSTDDTARERLMGRITEQIETYPSLRVIGWIDERGALRGFVYGYAFERGNWWPERIAPALVASGNAEWMNDAFELVEAVVDPAMQGGGIGSRLLTTLIESTQHRRILLATTSEPENRAKVLYARLGFETLVSDFRYGDEDVATWIMGRDRNGHHGT